MLIRINQRDLNTILAALRYYQEQGMGEPANRSDAIHAIASDGDDDTSMDAEGIDDLCQRLNTGPDVNAFDAEIYKEG